MAEEFEDTVTPREPHTRGVKSLPQGNLRVNCSCGWRPADIILITDRASALRIHCEHVDALLDEEAYERNTTASARKR